MKSRIHKSVAVDRRTKRACQVIDIDETDTIYNASPATLAYELYSVLSAQQIDSTLKAGDVLTNSAAPLLEQARISCLASLEDDARLAGLTRTNTVKPAVSPVCEPIER